MRRYETIFILRPSLNEDEITAIIERSTTILTEVDGQIIELDKWGMKKLAYPINYKKDGYYVFVEFEAEPEFPIELERIYRITEGVLKGLIVKKED